jgi:hypothetical protein
MKNAKWFYFKTLTPSFATWFVRHILLVVYIDKLAKSPLSLFYWFFFWAFPRPQSLTSNKTNPNYMNSNYSRDLCWSFHYALLRNVRLAFLIVSKFFIPAFVTFEARIAYTESSLLRHPTMNQKSFYLCRPATSKLLFRFSFLFRLFCSIFTIMHFSSVRLVSVASNR